MNYRLAIVSTHPIQYHSPWYRALAQHPALELEVFYCHEATQQEQARAGFGVPFVWDVPLLEGYNFRFLKNVAARPSVNEFGSLDTPEIANIIAREKFAAVLVNGWHYKSAWQTLRASWHTRTPVMVRSDSHLKTARHPLKKALKWPYYRWFIGKLAGCLAAGTWAREYFRHYGAAPERIFTVPHVIDVDYFSQEAEKQRTHRHTWREKWGLPQDAVVFLWAGKFLDKKRPLDFLHALRQAASVNKQVYGLMVGDGPMRAACEKLIADAHLPVRLTGFLNQSQIVPAYIAADCLVLPSNGEETWGLVVNEAMACGLPCLVSDQVGAGPDLIAGYETGAIFPLGDVTALAQLMLAYTSNPMLLRHAQEQVRLKVNEFRPHRAVEGVLAALATIDQEGR